ncbi:TonB-dependent receptor domain-containing protein [Puia sp.]|uniref:TonB-dependent receptor domain-containing protein n=1 Tax=Puia sp. TaxID=2045100 RepID=UPI002F4207EC
MHVIWKKIGLSILLLCAAAGIYAQDKGVIAGRVKDPQGQPVPAATVNLVDRSDPPTAKTIQTDTAGRFLIDGIPSGLFTGTITHAGTQPVKIDSIAVTPISGTIDLGDLVLLPAEKLLTEVVVSARTPAIRTGPEKKVFSVNQSLVSTGGSAADLLQNVPTLQVDAAGNVSLRGSTNLKVLVDGKRSLIGGGSVTQILQSLPASAIDRVEIITNPSAHYDAEGQAIINIVLKKNAAAGTNGTIAVTGGTRENYTAAAAISHQNLRVRAYGNYSYQRRNTYSNGYQDMTFLSSTDDTYFSNETFPSTTINRVHSAKGGLEYTLSPRDLVSFSGGYNSTLTNRSEQLAIANLTAGRQPTVLSSRHNGTTGNGHSFEAALDLTHKFRRPQQQLVFDLDYSRGSTDNLQLYATDIYNLDGHVADSTAVMQDSKKSNATNYNLQLDFTTPAGKRGKWEAGYRSQIGIGDNRQWDGNLDKTSGSYDPDYSLINRFTSTSAIHAAYLTYRRDLKGFSFQLGVRGELGRLNARLASFDSTGRPVAVPIRLSTQGLYPSLQLKKQVGDGGQLQFDYSRRVNRPTPRQLDPFFDVSDPVSYDGGNPRLQPEDLHSAELTFSQTGSKASLTTGLYYTRVNHVIKHIQSPPVNDVTIATYQNLRRAITTGLELIGSFHPYKGLDLTANVNGYERINDGDSAFGISATHGLSWNANVTGDLSFGKDLSFQLRADYKAPEVIVQDRWGSAWGLDAGARYELWHHKASIAVNGRDLFNTRQPNFLRVSDALLLDWRRVTYSARASVTFTYRFGHSGAGRTKL